MGDVIFSSDFFKVPELFFDFCTKYGTDKLTSQEHINPECNLKQPPSSIL